MINMVSDDQNELEEAFNDETFLVDVRTPEEFSEGSAKGAINIPLDSVPDRLVEFQGKDNIIVFCRSGNRSDNAKKFLLNNGIKNVLNGGTWQNVDELVKS